MNSGCYGDETSKILISIKAVDFRGNVIEINKDDINFFYRGTNLFEDLIYLSAKFKKIMSDKKLINEKINKFSKQKSYRNQAKLRLAVALLKIQKIRKPGSLLKILIVQKSHSVNKAFQAKHSNFFVNEGGASSEDIEKLINFCEKTSFRKTKY